MMRIVWQSKDHASSGAATPSARVQEVAIQAPAQVCACARPGGGYSSTGAVIASVHVQEVPAHKAGQQMSKNGGIIGRVTAMPRVRRAMPQGPKLKACTIKSARCRTSAEDDGQARAEGDGRAMRSEDNGREEGTDRR